MLIVRLVIRMAVIHNDRFIFYRFFSFSYCAVNINICKNMIETVIALLMFVNGEIKEHLVQKNMAMPSR